MNVLELLAVLAVYGFFFFLIVKRDQKPAARPKKAKAPPEHADRMVFSEVAQSVRTMHQIVAELEGVEEEIQNMELALFNGESHVVTCGWQSPSGGKTAGGYNVEISGGNLDPAAEAQVRAVYAKRTSLRQSLIHEAKKTWGRCNGNCNGNYPEKTQKTR